MIPDHDGDILRSDMPPRLREILRDKERTLQRTCRALWTFTTPNGERFIFGRLVRERTDELIVTVGRYQPHVGWIWPPGHHQKT